MGASSNCVCVTRPTVAMDQACLSLLGHHSNDGTIASRLSIATEGYGPSVQRRIVVMNLKISQSNNLSEALTKIKCTCMCS
jgi:hypothetical protein